jgi:hypothetical protein
MPNAKRRPAAAKAAAGITLTRIGSSALYAPPGGETWVFLLSDAASAPPAVELEETWSDRGTPARVGDYAFLLAVPSPSEASAVETLLRGVFGAPAGATGFGWAGKNAGSAYPVATALDDGAPIVRSDARIPAGTLTLYFAAKLPVVAARDSAGSLTGLLFTDPRPAQGAGAHGLVVPLLGPLAGTVVFLAALESRVIGDRSIKALADVRIDPIRLTNKERTRITPTGMKYVLSGNAAHGYHFLPYTP